MILQVPPPFLIELGAALLGGVVASLIAIVVWELSRRPRLALELVERASGVEPTIQTLRDDGERGFYHLRVRNVGKSPAYHCLLRIRFLEPHSHNELFRVNGKWDSGPEPYVLLPLPTRLTDEGEFEYEEREARQPFLVPFSEVMDIQPGDAQTFAILVKYDGDEDCFAFSSWGYILGNGHRVKDWTLAPGTYVAEVTVSYSGRRSITQQFTIVNRSKRIGGVEVTSGG